MSSGGEIEPAAEATNNMPGQDANARQEQHAVASPNPTIDDSKTPATAGAKKGGAAPAQPAPVQPTQSATDAPMKTTKSKPRSKQGRTKRPAQ